MVGVEELFPQGSFAPVLSHLLSAPLLGEAQSVNRGELFAIILLLKQIEPEAQGFADTARALATSDQSSLSQQ